MNENISIENFTYYQTATKASQIYEELIKRTLSTANMVVILFGTIGNLFTLLILLRKNVYKHSCMRYLAALCIVDTLCLYTWNFSMVYSMFRKRKVEHEGPLLCRLFSFYSYFTLQASSWIICAIGMDRLATVVLASSNRISKIVRNTRYIISIIILIMLLLNLVVIVNNAEPVPKNSIDLWNRTYTCYEPKHFFFIWDIVHIIFYSILPFSIILAENAFLTYLALMHTNRIRRMRNLTTTSKSCPNTSVQMSQLSPIDVYITAESEIKPSLITKLNQRFDKRKRVYRKNLDIRTSNKTKTATNDTSKLTRENSDKSVQLHAKKRKKMQSKGSHVTKLLMFLTVSFFFTTVPYSMFYALKLNFEFDNRTRNVVIGVLALLQYLRHAGNFLIYLSTSSIIKNEMKIIVHSFIQVLLAFPNKL